MGMRMKLLEIERLVIRGANSLAEHLHYYWPTVQDKDINEANITLHLGRAFADAGFLTFAEVARGPEGPKAKERMDMLAIDPVSDCTVACEYKLLKSAADVESIADDIDRIRDFRMQKPKKSLVPEIDLKKGQRFGLIAALTWDQKYAKWWTGNTSNPRKDKVWDKLTEHSVLGKQGKGCLWDSKPMTGLGYGDDMSHLLYIVFRLP